MAQSEEEKKALIRELFNHDALMSEMGSEMESEEAELRRGIGRFVAGVSTEIGYSRKYLKDVKNYFLKEGFTFKIVEACKDDICSFIAKLALKKAFNLDENDRLLSFTLCDFYF
jgi:hypothetical protein